MVLLNDSQDFDSCDDCHLIQGLFSFSKTILDYLHNHLFLFTCVCVYMYVCDLLMLYKKCNFFISTQTIYISLYINVIYYERSII